MQIKSHLGRRFIMWKAIEGTNGMIEVSEDGKTFKRVAELDNGCAKLVNPRPFKVARIVAEATSVGNSEIRISSPMIYPKG